MTGGKNPDRRIKPYGEDRTLRGMPIVREGLYKALTSGRDAINLLSNQPNRYSQLVNEVLQENSQYFRNLLKLIEGIPALDRNSAILGATAGYLLLQLAEESSLDSIINYQKGLNQQKEIVWASELNQARLKIETLAISNRDLRERLEQEDAMVESYRRKNKKLRNSFQKYFEARKRALEKLRNARANKKSPEQNLPTSRKTNKKKSKKDKAFRDAVKQISATFGKRAARVAIQDEVYPYSGTEDDSLNEAGIPLEYYD